MAIVARHHKWQLDAAETAAIRKFFQNPALFPEHQEADANALEDYMHRWGVVIDDESLAIALQKLSEGGVIKLKSDAQLRWEAVSKGMPQHILDALDAGMRQCRLISEGDEGLENKANLLGYLQGREVTTSNILHGAEYLSGGKGVRVHWQQRPAQNPPSTRGHQATSPEDYRWMKKSESNTPGPGLVSHSNNPKFNGQEDREKMRLRSQPTDDPMASHNWVWMQQAKALVGRTHSETQRVQKIVSQTPGGGRAAYEAGRAEQKRIENEHARGR